MSEAPPMMMPRPGPEHEVLQKDVGSWDAEIAMKMPGGPSQSRGVAENRLVCGGMWLSTEFRAEGGFEGRGLFGWDPQKKKYIGTWVDSMRTSLASMEGTWDEAARTMTMVCELSLPQGVMRWREITETVDADTQVWRQKMPGPGGEEVETMTVTYRRRR